MPFFHFYGSFWTEGRSVQLHFSAWYILSSSRNIVLVDMKQKANLCFIWLILDLHFRISNFQGHIQFFLIENQKLSADFVVIEQVLYTFYYFKAIIFGRWKYSVGGCVFHFINIVSFCHLSVFLTFLTPNCCQ